MLVHKTLHRPHRRLLVVCTPPPPPPLLPSLTYFPMIEAGSSYSHIVFQVFDDHKPDKAQCVDEHISATWPDRDKDPQLYAIVERFMTHKNCKSQRRFCYQEGRKQCNKRFPKSHQLATFDARGYPLYRRSNNGSDIVPNNRTLLLLFDAHINVEVSASVNIVSYISALCSPVPNFVLFCNTIHCTSLSSQAYYSIPENTLLLPPHLSHAKLLISPLLYFSGTFTKGRTVPPWQLRKLLKTPSTPSDNANRCVV